MEAPGAVCPRTPEDICEQMKPAGFEREKSR